MPRATSVCTDARRGAHDDEAPICRPTDSLQNQRRSLGPQSHGPWNACVALHPSAHVRSAHGHTHMRRAGHRQMHARITQKSGPSQACEDISHMADPSQSMQSTSISSHIAAVGISDPAAVMKDSGAAQRRPRTCGEAPHDAPRPAAPPACPPRRSRSRGSTPLPTSSRVRHREPAAMMRDSFAADALHVRHGGAARRSMASETSHTVHSTTSAPFSERPMSRVVSGRCAPSKRREQFVATQDRALSLFCPSPDY
jgi:hypothetical protein